MSFVAGVIHTPRRSGFLIHTEETHMGCNAERGTCPDFFDLLVVREKLPGR